MIYTLSIPVLPHVKSYILTRYPEDPLLVTRKNKIGKLICMCLEKTPRQITYELNYPKYSDHLDCKLTENYFKREGVYISPAKVVYLNQVVEDEIFDEIYIYLQNLMDNIGRKKQENVYIKNKGFVRDKNHIIIKNPDLFEIVEVDRTIRDILKKYNIDEKNMTFDRIKKAYQRKLKAL